MDSTMDIRRTLARCAVAALAASLAGCGGGGGSPADVVPGPQPVPVAENEPNRFLLFPNPQMQPDGSFQTAAQEYAEAYYRAIDPLNERDTLAKYKAKNGFETGTGSEINVIFGDRRDLGYGRNMHAHHNADGTVAFYVENFNIQAGAAYGYTPLNLEAAIVRDTKWHVGTNAIEFTPGPNGGVPFLKFYNFNAEGVRQFSVNLDNRGPKAMPGPCITCHGGRGDALTPPDSTGQKRFNLVQNAVSQARGDVQARLHAFEPDVFDFSTRPGWSRPEQEAKIKTINTWILCSYPIAAPSTLPEDACRRPTGPSEWQATSSAALIKRAYGGDGLPSATFRDEFVPSSWEAAGQTTLYREVVATSCRTCHALRGTNAQSDIDFDSYEKFASYADRIKAHLIDRGNMPLARIHYNAFWEDPVRPGLLADFLQAQGFTVRDSAGNVLRPGRPLADPGPDRVALPGSVRLSGENSLYANGYAWTLVSGPAGGAIADASSARATLTAPAMGTYVVQLVVSNGTVQSAPAQFRVVVTTGLVPAPADIRFADIKAVMQAPGSCTGCHSPAGPSPRPPVYYTNEDRNGDGTVGDATDERWFYEEVRSRINFTELGASPLLRKPSNNHHGGRLITGFDTSRPPGDPARARYDLFANWILNGAPF
jgi:mono/diheme cytochrome c family protein